jgi:MFS family permease
VVILISVFGLVNFSDALLLLRASHLGFGLAQVIGVYALYNLSYTLLSYPAGAVSDRLPRRIVFAVGLAIFAAAYIGLGITTSRTAVWLLFPVYGGYIALTDGVSKAWITDLAPADAKGRALGNQQALAGGGAVLAGIWAGLAWRGSGTFPLVFAGAVAGAVALVILAAGKRIERHPGGLATFSPEAL